MALRVLLGIVVACAAFSAIGVLAVGNVYERLHYLSSIGAVGIFALPAAVWLQHGASTAAVQALFIAIVIFFSNSVLTHATARAAWVREHGEWDPLAPGVEEGSSEEAS